MFIKQDPTVQVVHEVDKCFYPFYYIQQCLSIFFCLLLSMSIRKYVTFSFPLFYVSQIMWSHLYEAKPPDSGIKVKRMELVFICKVGYQEEEGIVFMKRTHYNFEVKIIDCGVQVCGLQSWLYCVLAVWY